MLAVLEEALCCFQENYAAQHGKKKRLFDKVEQWFFGTGDDWVFSFENICSALGFEAEYVRKGLVQWRKNALRRSAGRAMNQPQDFTRLRV
ncbi:MAG TPA: hypothetical protein VMT22_21785 [Terriglobales bacterium]|nr:hypothetical protein [Terriglobales bacterium]